MLLAPFALAIALQALQGMDSQLVRARRAQAGLPTGRRDQGANPASWKHVNLYGAYIFLDTLVAPNRPHATCRKGNRSCELGKIRSVYAEF
jgi:hypothetical protein